MTLVSGDDKVNFTNERSGHAAVAVFASHVGNGVLSEEYQGKCETLPAKYSNFRPEYL